MATTAELWVKYHLNPPKGRQPLQPVVSDATTLVIPYEKWIKNKCACCGKHGPSGMWKCEFTSHEEILLMCAACAFRDAYAKWTGFFSKHLLRIDLMYTLTYQSNAQSQKATS